MLQEIQESRIQQMTHGHVTGKGGLGLANGTTWSTYSDTGSVIGGNGARSSRFYIVGELKKGDCSVSMSSTLLDSE